MAELRPDNCTCDEWPIEGGTPHPGFPDTIDQGVTVRYDKIDPACPLHGDLLPMENQRTMQCGGETWEVSLSDPVGSYSSPRDLRPDELEKVPEPNKRLLRFSGAHGHFHMYVSVETRLNDLTEDDLCERVGRLRGDV